MDPALPHPALRALALTAGIGVGIGAGFFDAFGLDGDDGCGVWQVLGLGLAAGLVAYGSGLRPPDEDPLPGRQCVLLASWLGLLTGAVEILHQMCRRHVFGIAVRQPVDLLWMAPLTNLLVFTVIGCALVASGLLLRVRITFRRAAFGTVFVATWSQLHDHTWLHDAATLMLSAGVATALVRATAGRSTRVVGLARRTLPGLLAGLAILAAGVAGYRATGGGLARPPRAEARPGAPNVLLLVLDATRADHLGLYGYRRDTSPHLDALGREGVVFEHAISNSPWTLPSHAALFTGRFEFETDVDWKVPLDARHPTLAEHFTARGYSTAGFVGNIYYCSRVWGLARGFQHYEDYYANAGITALSSGTGRALARALLGEATNELARNDGGWLTERLLAWLDARDPERPFFAFVNYYDAHALYVPPAPWDTRFLPASRHLLEWYARDDWNEQETREFVNAYDGALGYQDHHLGTLLAGLRARGLFDDTLIVVVGDHGEHFGEHGLFDHGNSLYSPLLHVPLVMAWPGRVGARRVADTVSINDVPSTIFDLVDAGVPHPFPGRTLARFWTETVDPSAASPALAELEGGITMYLDGWHYIVNADGSEEIYEISNDPGEEHDRIATERGRAMAAKMQREVGKMGRR